MIGDEILGSVGWRLAAEGRKSVLHMGSYGVVIYGGTPD